MIAISALVFLAQTGPFTPPCTITSLALSFCAIYAIVEVSLNSSSQLCQQGVKQL